MKSKILISIILVIGLIVVVQITKPITSAAPSRIEDVIWKTFSSARTGNVQQYLDCFTGPSLANLQADRTQKKEAAFRDYIRQGAQDVKGVSIINGIQENPQQAVFEVEVVYADRNEDQTFSLQEIQGQWKITQISRPVMVKQPVTYFEEIVK